jgi:hypothetical protein
MQPARSEMTSAESHLWAVLAELLPAYARNSKVVANRDSLLHRDDVDRRTRVGPTESCDASSTVQLRPPIGPGQPRAQPHHTSGSSVSVCHTLLQWRRRCMQGPDTPRLVISSDFFSSLAAPPHLRGFSLASSAAARQRRKGPCRSWDSGHRPFAINNANDVIGTIEPSLSPRAIAKTAFRFSASYSIHLFLFIAHILSLFVSASLLSWLAGRACWTAFMTTY